MVWGALPYAPYAVMNDADGLKVGIIWGKAQRSELENPIKACVQSQRKGSGTENWFQVQSKWWVVWCPPAVLHGEGRGGSGRGQGRHHGQGCRCQGQERRSSERAASFSVFSSFYSIQKLGVYSFKRQIVLPKFLMQNSRLPLLTEETMLTKLVDVSVVEILKFGDDRVKKLQVI